MEARWRAEAGTLGPSDHHGGTGRPAASVTATPDEAETIRGSAWAAVLRSRSRGDPRDGRAPSGSHADTVGVRRAVENASRGEVGSGSGIALLSAAATRRGGTGGANSGPGLRARRQARVWEPGLGRWRFEGKVRTGGSHCPRRTLSRIFWVGPDRTWECWGAPQYGGGQLPTRVAVALPLGPGRPTCGWTQRSAEP